jgi:hypothetical protein
MVGSRHVRRWITLVFVITGCIRDQLVPCGTLACPRGSTCIADQLCATPDQIEACTSLADAAPCDSGTGLGYCELGACVPNTCGDGMLTGNEVCDGSLTTVTCGDLGYYRGATSCSGGCALDRTGCEGRCGDAIIDGDAREECDTAPPVETCTSFGRDYGSLGCSRFCTPAITSDCFY